MTGHGRFRIRTALALSLALTLLFAFHAAADGVVTPEDALGVKRAGDAVISPDGAWIACTVHVPRGAEEEAGAWYTELHLVSTATGASRPFVTGKVNVGSPAFSPDGSRLAFTMRRGEKAQAQIWVIPVDGGEAAAVTKSKTGVGRFRWHPGGGRIGYLAVEQAPAVEKKLGEKGYGFIYFEENLRNAGLYLADVSTDGEPADAERIELDGHVVSFEFSPDGRSAALAVCPKNLIDHVYMFQKIHILDIAARKVRRLSDNPGKLGNFAFSPDGKRIAYAAALTREDHAVSQAFVIDVSGGAARNLTPDAFRGHVEHVGWKDAGTVWYLAAEGAWNTLCTVSARGGARDVILDGRALGIVFNAPECTRDFRHFAFTGGAPAIPGDVFYWKRGAKELRRLTELNPWIAERALGRQEVVTYKARDGLEIEGILVYPVDWREGRLYPLIVTVHGGPEAHYRNEWIGSYFHPAQVLAGKGYFVFHPNYRASTGYGVGFAMQGYMDAAGKEFDDIADGIDDLVARGFIDQRRVGLGGGSYGGFAAAWFASYYTEKVRAVTMFVGISNLISKRGTTDIPYEELYVHSGKKLDEDRAQWEFSLARSPIFWARQSRTAVLILTGTADTRVHPSQSLEFYRRLKMNDHPAVRLVKYPGEGHGNRKQPGRIDVLYRHLQWYDWYVRDMMPLEGPLPPLLIHEHYGIDLGGADAETK